MALEKIDHSVLEGDNIVYIENDRIRLGVNLALGGAVTYLAELDKPNLINSYDWGRQVQMSFYGHPVPYEPEGTTVQPAWKYLGWNPIQCGDCYGHRSVILDYRCENGEIYVKCIPMQWPMDNVPGECTFETWYRLNGGRVEVTSRLNNARSDTAQYPARTQELPAVYTNGVWCKLVSYTGAAPFTGGDVTEICTKENGRGWPWVAFHATEHWAALVDDDNYGLGVYNPSTNEFLGGFAGEKGWGGPKDGNTGYISPEQREILDHDIVYTYNYALIVGDLPHIRAQAAELEAQQPKRLNWNFANDRAHFSYNGITDEGLPQNGCLEFAFGPDTALVSPPLLLPAGKRRVILDGTFTGGALPCTVRLTDFSTDMWEHTERHDVQYSDFAAELCGDGAKREQVLEFTAEKDALMFRLVFRAAGTAKLCGIRVE